MKGTHSKRILICPLDWGLGHATRCVPIIRELEKQGAEVVIAADHRPLEYLKNYFPHLQFIRFEGYNIDYPEGNTMVLKMLFAIPKFIHGIWKEHQTLKNIIKEKRIDLVISDNRYGCWSEEVPSVFITHQLMVKSPFFEGLGHHIVSYFISKYQECWVPDIKGQENLSGDLAHHYPIPVNTFFIGPLSRFGNKFNNEISENERIDVLAIISGPEPQRTIFEKLVIKSLSENPTIRAIIARGTPEKMETDQIAANITALSNPSNKELESAILNAEVVISRPGYSTIMDLSVFGKKAIFIPTPGQTEQEYLSGLYHEKGKYLCMKQNEFNLKIALEEVKNYTGISVKSDDSILRNVISRFLQN